MRSFIGVNFSKEVKADISSIQRKVRDNAVQGRFKHVDNFHITLKFLGEIENSQAPQIAEQLEAIAGQHESFQLNLSGIGAFQGRGIIRTLYLGMKGELEALGQLNGDIEAAMETLGFKRENRPFTPHITISQELTLNTSFEELKKQIDTSDTEPIYVDKIELIKSEQIQNKRIYTSVYSFALKRK